MHQTRDLTPAGLQFRDQGPPDQPVGPGDQNPERRHEGR